MLNVSCQKQKQRSFPLTLTQGFMEFVGRPRPSEACSLLAVPGLKFLDVEEDDGDVVISIRPKSSPIPSRKSSFTDEDSEPEPTLCGSRRVSFADAKGLSLVQVKKFDLWDVPKLPGYDSTSTDGPETLEFFLSPLTFSLPLPSHELFAKVEEQKLELETIELLPGTTILKGVIRVLNISYDKSVYVRTTLDNWCTHFDLLAEYIPGSSDGVMDCFSFKLTLVPPFKDQRARVDFCLRYETPTGTFWANNNNKNYTVVCQKDKGQRDSVNKKSCLKTVSQNVSPVENISPKPVSSQENKSTGECVGGSEGDVMKDQNISEGQSVSSREEEQKLLVENGQSSSRRRQRKAARMAEVTGYFTQRDGGDSNRDESPPEIKQATQGVIPGDRHVCVQPFPEGNGESERPQFVLEALKTHSQPPHKAGQTCREQPEKPEPLARDESATDIPNKHSADQAAPAEQQNIRKVLTKTHGRSQSKDMSFTCLTNTAAASRECLALLDRQGLRKTSSENQNPEKDLNRPPETTLSGHNGPPKSKSEINKVERNLTENQESNSQCLNTESSEEHERNEIPNCANTEFNLTENEKRSNQIRTKTSQGQDQPPGHTSGLNSKVLNPQTALESENLQEVAQEAGLTFDLHMADPQEQILTDETRGGEDEEHNADTTLNKDKLLQVLDDFIPNQIINTKINELVSHWAPDRTKVTPETLQGDTEGRVPEMFRVKKDEKHHSSHLTLTKSENFLLEDNAEVRNWEVMVKDDEIKGLINEDVKELLDFKAENIKAEEKDTTDRNTSKIEEFVGKVVSGEVNREEVDNAVVMEGKKGKREEDAAEVSAGKCSYLESDGVKEAQKVGVKVKKEENETVEAEKTEIKKNTFFIEMLQVSIEEKSVKAQTEIRENTETHLNYEGVKQKDQTEITYLAAEVKEDDFEQRSEVIKHRAEEGFSALMRNQLQVENTSSSFLFKHDGFQSNNKVTNNNSSALVSPAEAESDQTGHSSSESDSDDEVELYMHCLRTASAPTQKDAGFSVSRRPSVSRGKGTPALMPSINESLDEEVSIPLENPDDLETAATASGQETISRDAQRWKNAFSCCSVSKAFLYSTLMVVFVVAAYHYDFLACFGLYLMSVIWLFCQRERQPAQNHDRAG